MSELNVEFPLVAIGTPQDRIVQILNSAPSSIEITGMQSVANLNTFTGPASLNFSVVMDDCSNSIIEQSCNLRITFNPSTPGVFEEAIRVDYRNLDQQEKFIVVLLRGEATFPGGPPAIGFSSPAPGSQINSSNQSIFPVAGTCNQADGTPITFNLGGSTTCVGNLFNTNLDLSSAPQGPLSLVATMLTASDTLALQKDSIAPSLTVTTPTTGFQINLANESSVAVSGTCDDASATLSFSHGAGSIVCDGANFSGSLDFSGESDGAISFIASITDAATNSTSSAPANISKDTLAPNIAVLSPASGFQINIANQSSLTVSGTCDEVGPISLSHGVGPLNCDGAVFSGSIDFSGVSDGSFALTASLSDGHGNNSSSTPVNLSKDTIAPSITLTAPTSGFIVNSSNMSAVTVSGNCNEAGPVSLSHGAGSLTCNGSTFSGSIDFSGVSNGPVALVASLQDAAGNPASDSVNITVSISACGGASIGACALSGSGNSGDPYLIGDVSCLQEMSAGLACHYQLANDIDATATSTWNAGAGWTAVGDFTGRLDGNGFRVHDLYTTGYGMFRRINGGAEVTNITLDTFTVNVGTSGFGAWDVGILVGQVNGDANLNNITVTDSSMSGGVFNLGGLIGAVANSTLTVSITNIDILNFNLNSSGWHASGLIGTFNNGNFDATIDDVLIDNFTLTGTSNHAGGLIAIFNLWNAASPGANINNITVSNSNMNRGSGLIGIQQTPATVPIVLDNVTVNNWSTAQAGAGIIGGIINGVSALTYFQSNSSHSNTTIGGFPSSVEFGTVASPNLDIQ